MTIELRIIQTGKSYSPRDKWRHMAEPETRRFGTLAEARAYLAKRYGKAKRAPMYRDVEGAPPIRIGYVIGFRASDWSHYPVEKWLQQDWIEFRESSPLNLAEVGKGLLRIAEHSRGEHAAPRKDCHVCRNPAEVRHA